jgi:molybdopterin-containing oxidoreductase family membrane subunit
VVGAYSHLDQLLTAARAARDARLDVVDIYSPVPVEEAAALISPGRSPVRFVTLVGALSGLVGGFALAYMTSHQWNMVVGGKPVDSVIPFMVVGFELTILIGALSTLVALLFFARLPNRRFPPAAYRDRFSCDQFGLYVGCESAKAQLARDLLKSHGAADIYYIESDSTEARP